MATYLNSLSRPSVVSNDQTSPGHPTTITGSYTTSDGTPSPSHPYNLFLEDVNSDGRVNTIYNIPDSNVSFVNGTYTINYNATEFHVAQGDKLEVATTDTSDGRTISSQGLVATSNIDGYLSGSTVFIDANNNGVLDGGEYSTTSDYLGTAYLPDAAGQIVSIGGTDTLTGLTFTGTMSAVAGATVVTPLTTLVNVVAQSNGGNVAAAQASVATSLGLNAALNLNNFDPIVATKAGVGGAATALAQSAAVIDTAKLISAAGAAGNPLAVIAAQIASGGGRLDLTDASTVADLAVKSGVSASSASAIGQIAAASNTAVIQAGATSTTDVNAIINAVAAVSRVAQGSTASQVAAAGGDASTLAQVVAANTGSALQSQIAQSAASGSSGIVTGNPTNNAVTDISQSLRDFTTTAYQDHPGASIDYISGPAGGTVSYGGQIGVVAPGSNLSVNLSQSADLYASSGTTLDLSGTPRFDANGNHIAVNVQVGEGNNKIHLNHGPGSISSSIGNDTLISGGGFDTLSSTDSVDLIRAGGQSFIAGGSIGGDTLRGGLFAQSHDTLYAGSNGDLMITNQGHNLIFGNENDTIRAGLAQDTIVAGFGAETIHGGLNASIYGGGLSLMDRGNNNTYDATGADTIHASQYDNTVNLLSDATAVTVDGRTGNGNLTVNVAAGGHGNDTLFGGFNTSGTNNLTVNVSEAFTVQKDLDQNGLHVVQLAGGQTLHVDYAVINFNGTKTNV